jgi:hypothetical protein
MKLLAKTAGIAIRRPPASSTTCDAASRVDADGRIDVFPLGEQDTPTGW